ncbi:MAG: hypothetical protein H7123_06590 [Thermoleophilia bacterium]|nr:hypothetical protein [Thermoleophilia bacterium]
MSSPTTHGTRGRARLRRADVAVLLVAIMLCALPFMPSVHAAGNSLVQSQINVDQKVRPAAMISQPQDAAFHAGRSGKSSGAIGWDIWTSSADGYKLVVSSDQTPAMQDRQADSSIGDMLADPAAWSVGSNERRFGFSARGVQALNRYGNGSQWRGFRGTRGIEISRHTGSSVALTRTWLRVASEFNSALPAGARPVAHVTATAVPNL